MLHFSIYRFLLSITALMMAVTLHEVAHGWVAWRMGDPTARAAGRLTLNPLRHLDPMGSVVLPLMLFVLGAPFLFGYARPVPVNFHNLRDPKKGTILVGAAGVVANLLFATAAGLLFQALKASIGIWAGTFIAQPLFVLIDFLTYCVVINAVLMIFNLIPIPPLDGSRIVAMLLPPEMRNQYMRIEPFGMLIIIFLLVTDVVGKIFALFVNPFVMFFLGR